MDNKEGMNLSASSNSFPKNNTNFMDLPTEVKYHIFQYFSLHDLTTGRSVCHTWNYLISVWNYFLERISLKISDRVTLKMLLNSYTIWTKLKIGYTQDKENSQSSVPKKKKTVNNFLLRIIQYSNSDGICSSLTNLTFCSLKKLKPAILIKTLASCPNLKILSLDKISFKQPLELVEISSEIIESGQSVARKLEQLKLHGVGIPDMNIFYECFVLNTEKISEISIIEGKYWDFIDNDITNKDEVIDDFLEKTGTILLKNAPTLKTLHFSLLDQSAMFKYYRRVFSTLHLIDQLQLKKLSLYLYPKSDGIRMTDTYFWTDWLEEEFDFIGNDAFVSPTELLNIWKDFIRTQRNLESLSLPHIELSLDPFEENHNPALLNLFLSLPPTIKRLNASLEQKGMSEMGVPPVYKNLITHTTSINLSHYVGLIDGNDPEFLEKEQTEDTRLVPNSPNLWGLRIHFFSEDEMEMQSEKITLRILRVILRGYPINLTQLFLRGTLPTGDNGLQLIIEYLPLLQVLQMQSRKPITDYGLTGISKQWLKVYMKTYRSIPDIMDFQQCVGVKPDFVGPSLSNLEHLRILRLPNIQKLSDIGICYGLKLPRLKELCLHKEKPYEKITDWGLMQLAKNCPNLEIIKLITGNSVTSQGISRFITAGTKILKDKSILRQVTQCKYNLRTNSYSLAHNY